MASEDSEQQILLQILRNPHAEPKHLSLQLLEGITEDFSNKNIIGSGTFGVVYKGNLQDGSKVAVKKLKPIYNTNTEFLDKFDAAFNDEVDCLKKVKHRNIVRFLGYCAATREVVTLYKGKQVSAEEHERLLCFEYVPKGSLHDHIKDKLHELEWQKCYQIIRGICHGLDYLHAERRIYHLDIKPDNILLDNNLVPKITDFGLSRRFNDQSMISTMRAAGTRGYMAPEIYRGKITRKADVYSLGVIVIELVTGSKEPPPIETVHEKWRHKLCTLWHKKDLYEQAYKQIAVCIETAIKSVQEKPDDRPTTSEIIQILMTTVTNGGIQTMFMKDCPSLESIDLHPGGPWILLGLSSGTVKIFNYETQEWLSSFEPSDKPVHSVVFIASKQWIVAGNGEGFIFVYGYDTSRSKEKQEKLICHKVVHREASIYRIRSLAVHPYKPYLLSSSGSKIMLWDWEKHWDCIGVFQWHSNIVTHVTFNPVDPKRFASASWDGTIAEWTLGCATPEFTQEERKNDPFSQRLCLVDYLTCNPTLLIDGSTDGTTKIWDRKSLRHMLQHERHVSVTAACYHPEISTLITGTEGGTVCLWPCEIESVVCANFSSPKKQLKFDLGRVCAIRCLKGSRRVLIAHEQGLVMIEIDAEELSN